MNRHETGDYGEALAVDYLVGHGYKILHVKYRCYLGEIDIIAEKDGYVVFTEVKLRRSLALGYPREAVGTVKQRRIRRTALYYIASQPPGDRDYRFDVIEILDMEEFVIEHIENAF